MYVYIALVTSISATWMKRALLVIKSQMVQRSVYLSNGWVPEAVLLPVGWLKDSF